MSNTSPERDAFRAALRDDIPLLQAAAPFVLEALKARPPSPISSARA
jgi:hypothetical protein